MKNLAFAVAFLFFVPQNQMAAAPFLVICPNIAQVAAPEKRAEKQHFFKKKKGKKLAARLAGPSDWEEDEAREGPLWLALAGFALLGIGLGLSIALELETLVFLLACALIASVLALIAIIRAGKSAQPLKAIARSFGWFTIVVTGLLAFIADISGE